MVKFWNKGWENIYPDSNPGRGSLKVVVRELWSTKYRTPSAVYFISQPGGRGCSLIILQQGEGGSEHGPSRRREPCAGGGPAGHTSLEKYTEWIWRIWKLLGACWAQKKKKSRRSPSPISEMERTFGREADGWNVIYNLFKCWLNVIWNLTSCRCHGLLLRHKRKEKKRTFRFEPGKIYSFETNPLSHEFL